MPERTSTLHRAASASTAALLAIATAAFVLWQNAHVAVLWDLSYLLDSSYRISLGQIPYRDFPFAHAPLTFLIQAAIIHLTGRVYLHHILYAAFAGAAATLLTWRILLHQLRNRINHANALALLLTAPLTVLGIYAIYPHPIYDSDAILSILFALWALQRITPTTTPLLCLATGAALIPPVFFKQNIGLFFLAATIACLVAIAIANRAQRHQQLLLLAGATLTLAATLAAIHHTAGLANYRYWTLTFATQRRLPSLGAIVDIYHQVSLLWTLPTALAALYLLRRNTRWADLTALALLAAPFLWTLASLPFLNDTSDRSNQLLSLWPHLLLLAIILALANLRHRPTLQTALPLILLATIHGTFLSQQLWGSTYATWPLLMLLIASLLLQVPRLALPLTGIIAATLLIAGSAYAVSHDRLSYTKFDGPLVHSTITALKGLATPGPWLPAFDELVQDTNRAIPATDAILLFPGQDPFYYATGRTPRFPVLLFDPATNPYSPQQLADQTIVQNVRWLILPRTLQLDSYPIPNSPDYLTALQPLFTLDHTLTNYDIYRRR